MTILFINNSLINDGGVETVLASLSNHFQKEHNVSILVLGKKVYFNQDDFNGINIHFMGKHYRAKIAKNFIKHIEYKYFYYKKLANKINSLKPDLIIVMKENHVELISTLLEYYKINSKIIGSMHNNYKCYDDIKHKLKEKYKNINCLTVPTEQNRKFYENHVQIPTYVMPNTINLQEIKKDKENIVLLVSRVDYDKRVDLFIKATAICQEELSGYRFIVIGGGAELEKMKELAKKINSKVELLGQLPSYQTYEYFAKSKIFVLSSEMESYGLVLLEAAFYECARISTRFYGDSLGVLLDDKKNGLICELDEYDMAEKIVKLAKDSQLRENMVKLAREKFFKLNYDTFKQWDKLIKKYEDCQCH